MTSGLGDIWNVNLITEIILHFFKQNSLKSAENSVNQIEISDEYLCGLTHLGIELDNC